MLNIVLFEPEIPANTGNIGRTCVATNTRLHLIEPLGFRLNEKAIKRAGMDYWDQLDVTTYIDYNDFLEKNPGAKIYMATTKAPNVYTDVKYEPDCYIMFEKANEILGFRITDIMFAGTDEELRQTRVTQPAVFLHSVIMAKALGVEPDAVAGHSLGEFSALVVAGALSFEDGLKLVSKRAMAMQAACEAQPGTMAAILGLDDKTVEEICASIDGVVVAANYNCPGQLVISGAVEAVDAACEKAKAAGARRALRLPVGGAFHSPLMEPAKQELEKAIDDAPFRTPTCPIYQNVDAKPYTDPAAI